MIAVHTLRNWSDDGVCTEMLFCAWGDVVFVVRDCGIFGPQQAVQVSVGEARERWRLLRLDGWKAEARGSVRAK